MLLRRYLNELVDGYLLWMSQPLLLLPESGWLQFNKAIFLLALKTLPQIIASIIGLILMCALMAL
ncbi:hypothetical protein VPJ08_20215, partial [Acinetobacter baumannii]|uniref:hypothetical protein n=1 Tax=Acinetobacter baumannii TaxID=470 RepID=UPI002FE11933